MFGYWCVCVWLLVCECGYWCVFGYHVMCVWLLVCMSVLLSVRVGLFGYQCVCAGYKCVYLIIWVYLCV